MPNKLQKIYFRIPFTMYFVGKKDMEPLCWASSNSTWSKLLLFRKHFNPSDGSYFYKDI